MRWPFQRQKKQEGEEVALPEPEPKVDLEAALNAYISLHQNITSQRFVDVRSQIEAQSEHYNISRIDIYSAGYDPKSEGLASSEIPPSLFFLKHDYASFGKPYHSRFPNVANDFISLLDYTTVFFFRGRFPAEKDVSEYVQVLANAQSKLAKTPGAIIFSACYVDDSLQGLIATPYLKGDPNRPI